jgi:hypothetical protein
VLLVKRFVEFYRMHLRTMFSGLTLWRGASEGRTRSGVPGRMLKKSAGVIGR